MRDKILDGGTLKRIHVNQLNLRRRIKQTCDAPCYTVKYQGQTYWAKEIEIMGPSRLIERIDNPLSCGARLWIETNSPVFLYNCHPPASHQTIGA